MEIVCWETEMYMVYLSDDYAEYHFFKEEEALKFINTYKDVFSHMKKIERAVVK